MSTTSPRSCCSHCQPSQRAATGSSSRSSTIRSGCSTASSHGRCSGSYAAPGAGRSPNGNCGFSTSCWMQGSSAFATSTHETTYITETSSIPSVRWRGIWSSCSACLPWNSPTNGSLLTWTGHRSFQSRHCWNDTRVCRPPHPPAAPPWRSYPAYWAATTRGYRQVRAAACCHGGR